MSTWVLLRGLMRESRHWGEFPALLAEALPGTRILTPDLPGNGRLYREASPARVAQMVEHCRATLQAQGAAPPYNLLALSLGGMVAVHWAHAYPDEVQHLALLSTSMRPFSPFHRRLRPRNYPAVIAMALGRRDPRVDERVILRLTSSRTEAQASRVLQAWIEYARECPVSRGNALRQLLAAARFSAPAGIPARGRVLLLAGAQDHLVHPDCSAQVARAWGAPLSLHPDAGHDLPLDDPAWVCAQLRDWLSKSD